MAEVVQGSWREASETNRVASGEAIVRLKRKPARLRDRVRSYRVLIDGTLVGRIRDGETADFAVRAGRHDVRVKLDWTRSQVLPLDVPPGGIAQVDCGPAGSAMTSFFDVFAALGKNGRPWIDLHQVSGDANATPPSPPLPYGQYPPPPPLASTNGFAVAALVLGIVWLGGLGSILALVFGSVAKKQIDRSAGRQGGRGMAIAGVVLGWVGIAALIPFIVGAVAADDHPSTPTTTTVLRPAAAAQSYLASITRANSASDTFAREAAQWNNQTTDAQAEREALPVIAALQDLERRLLGTAWPAPTAHDAKTLASAVAPVVDDLRGLARLNLAAASNWEATFARDATNVKAADKVLRRDLGLPPSSGGGTPTGSRGGGSCFGCVTITTVTWSFYSAPGTLTDYQNCLPRSATVASNTQVAGPPVRNPTREFTYRANFTIGCTVPDIVEFTVGKVELQGADPPISVANTDPTVPFVVTPHNTQTLAVTFHALDGNYYKGPLVIDVILD